MGLLCSSQADGGGMGGEQSSHPPLHRTGYEQTAHEDVGVSIQSDLEALVIDELTVFFCRITTTP